MAYDETDESEVKSSWAESLVVKKDKNVEQEKKTMAEIKVSVIVPVYNTEKYLEQCLGSIVNQSLPEIEVICVDDGSTDDSAGIIKEFQKKDPRIQVYYQQNMYAGVARNNGMFHAKGQYCIFWDSDDFFDHQALEKMYNQAVRDHADICVCAGYNYFDETKEVLLFDGLLNTKMLPEEIPFCKDTWEDNILSFTNGTAWNKMFRREFICTHGLLFSPTRRGNDFGFVTKALCSAETITVVTEPLVFYRAFRKGGLTDTIDESCIEIIDEWISTKKELIKRGVFPERSFENRTLKAILGVLRTIGSWKAFERVADYLKSSALAELGLTLREPGYYYVGWQETMLEHLYKETPGDFVLSYLDMMNIRLLEKTTSKRIRVQELKEKEKQYKEREKQYKEREKQNKSTIKRMEKEMALLKESRSYRIGRLITYLPRKIKALL